MTERLHLLIYLLYNWIFILAEWAEIFLPKIFESKFQKQMTTCDTYNFPQTVKWKNNIKNNPLLSVLVLNILYFSVLGKGEKKIIFKLFHDKHDEHKTK